MWKCGNVEAVARAKSERLVFSTGHQPRATRYSPGMLWLFAGFVFLSASAILWATLGPLRTASNVRVLQGLAFAQYAVVVVLLGAKFLGKV